MERHGKAKNQKNPGQILVAFPQDGRAPAHQYSCHSVDSWAAGLALTVSGARFAISLCLRGFSNVGSGGVAPFPQGMSRNIKQFAGSKPGPFPRGASVLAFPRPQTLPGNLSEEYPAKSRHIRHYPAKKNLKATSL